MAFPRKDYEVSNFCFWCTVSGNRLQKHRHKKKQRRNVLRDCALSTTTHCPALLSSSAPSRVDIFHLSPLKGSEFLDTFTLSQGKDATWQNVLQRFDARAAHLQAIWQGSKSGHPATREVLHEFLHLHQCWTIRNMGDMFRSASFSSCPSPCISSENEKFKVT